MARVRKPPHLTRLVSALKSGLDEAGIPAQVDFEPIQGTRLHRVYVVAPKFKALRPSERQDLVWRIAQGVLSPEEQILISMIMTITPREMAGSEA